MVLIDLIIENIFVFLAGAGFALVPFSSEKLSKSYTHWKYRETRRVYGTIIPEMIVREISFPDSELWIGSLLKIAPLEEWEQVGRVLEELIHQAGGSRRERLEKVLGKVTVEKWRRKYEKREKIR